jgi:hypothetical protein
MFQLTAQLPGDIYAEFWNAELPNLLEDIPLVFCALIAGFNTMVHHHTQSTSSSNFGSTVSSPMDRSWRSTTLLKILYTGALLLQKNNSGVPFRKLLFATITPCILGTYSDCIYFSLHDPF